MPFVSLERLARDEAGRLYGYDDLGLWLYFPGCRDVRKDTSSGVFDIFHFDPGGDSQPLSQVRYAWDCNTDGRDTGDRGPTPQE